MNGVLVLDDQIGESTARPNCGDKDTSFVDMDRVASELRGHQVIENFVRFAPQVVTVGDELHHVMSRLRADPDALRGAHRALQKLLERRPQR